MGGLYSEDPLLCSYVSALSSKYKYFCQQMATAVNSQKKNNNFSHLLQKGVYLNAIWDCWFLLLFASFIAALISLSSHLPYIFYFMPTANTCHPVTRQWKYSVLYINMYWERTFSFCLLCVLSSQWPRQTSNLGACCFCSLEMAHRK